MSATCTDRDAHETADRYDLDAALSDWEGEGGNCGPAQAAILPHPMRRPAWKPRAE